jgi:hypothetical protein
VLVAVATLAGVAATIVIASRVRDEPLPVADQRVLNVPVDGARNASADERDERNDPRTQAER